MGTTLATKQDLLLLRQDQLLLKQEMVSGFALQTQEIATLRTDVARDMATLGLRMTVRLGSMLVVGFGLTIAAMRLWL